MVGLNFGLPRGGGRSSVGDKFFEWGSKDPRAKRNFATTQHSFREFSPRVLKPWFPNRGSRLPAEQRLN